MPRRLGRGSFRIVRRVAWERPRVGAERPEETGDSSDRIGKGRYRRCVRRLVEAKQDVHGLKTLRTGRRMRENMKGAVGGSVWERFGMVADGAATPHFLRVTGFVASAGLPALLLVALLPRPARASARRSRVLRRIPD